uniref:Acetyl-coenzyme A carboxylase carboxyl transferase subunit beta, chloroplastic n=1 Tax=Tecomaria capensis TaxID=140035 RepID=A0A2P1GAE0_TECCA|nr:acetyl-CoA carboxylase carboxyltransferase beta subunit [Tecomaria capensis]AVM81915.1 acetyl-CoA carboxylase carboxyltransferase beta subunit [Tecomaria capensis]
MSIRLVNFYLLYFYANGIGDNGMERSWFCNSRVFKKALERRYGIKKSTDNLGPIENTSKSGEIEDPNRKGGVKIILGVKDFLNLIFDYIFLVRDSNGDSYSIYFDIENHIFEIDIDHSFLSHLESFFSSYIKNGSTSEDSLDNRYMYDTQSSWNNHITSCIDSYLQAQICIDTSIVGDSSERYISMFIFEKLRTSSESERSNIQNRAESSDLTLRERSNDLEETPNSNDLEETPNSNDLEETPKYPNYKDLWVQCENCYGLNYKQFLKPKMNICEECGFHLKMNSSDRIEGLIDPGTWDPMDEDMVSIDAIGWDLEEEEQPDKQNNQQDQQDQQDNSNELENQLGLGKGLYNYNPRDEQPYTDGDSGLEETHANYKQEQQETWNDPDDLFDSEEQHELYNEDESRFHSGYHRYKDQADYSEDHYMDGEQHDPYKYGEEQTYNDGEDVLEEEPFNDDPYHDRIDSYQTNTGLTEAVQTGVGELNGIPVAIGVMDFQFMGGSMGSVVGEKITRLIEYATNEFLPLIIVCASGGARMQEGSLSLMQMAKISSALYDYQSNKKLFYVSILTSPTTGGVTASFGMLGDIIIAEPNAYIAFAGKRVIEQTLNITVPEGSQETEPLFEKGLFDLIVPRNLLKGVLSELLQLHGFFPLNSPSIK